MKNSRVLYYLSRFIILMLLNRILYWTAGYFITWQNPELRAFYGSPGDALPFWQHTLNTLTDETGLFPFQALRGQKKIDQ